MPMAGDDCATTPLRAFKSCVECRRRKIRCSWTNEATKTCRRCEERGVPCVPQKPTHSPASSKANSKARISRLEAEVAQLRNVVSAIQIKSDTTTPEDGNLIEQTSAPVAHGYEMAFGGEQGEMDSDDASSRTSEIVIQDCSSYLDPLFQNEWISTHTQQNDPIQQSQKGRTITQRLDATRSALQPLIPTIEEMKYLGSHLPVWLSLFQELIPTTALASSKEGVIAAYPDMKRADADPLRLACWLLALAITALIIRPPADSPANPSVEKFLLRFPQSVQRTVHYHIISHDSMCGSLAGLETALLFWRFNMMKGIIQKSWLGLRRVISIAEMIGLPRASRLLQQRQINGQSSIDGHTMAKATLWESICSVERFAGTLMHFPIATRLFPMTAPEPLVSNGKVNNASFWKRLGNIAVQVHDTDELASTPGTEAELYRQVLRLDNELRVLSSGVPREWWIMEQTKILNAAHIVKYQYYNITMRIHLPFVVRADLEERFAFSRMAGIEACRCVVSTWCDLRVIMPPGIFFARVFDAQAFAASVVLLLNSYNAGVRAGYVSNNMTPLRDDTEILLNKVVELMDEKSREPIGYECAQQAASAIRSLASLLSGDGGVPSQLTLKIPLLGTITIRRKLDKRPSYADSRASTSQSNQSSTVSVHSHLSSHQTSEYTMTTGYQTSDSYAELPQFSANSVDDMFSWIFNPDDELLFHDNMVLEDFTQDQWLNQEQWQPV